MTVLVVAEHRRGELRDVSLELLSAGHQLADATGGDLHVGVISGDVEGYADRLNREGVDAIHTVAHGEEFNHDVYTQAVERLFDAVEPTVLLVPNSVNGLDYAPAVAERLDVPLVTDAVDLAYDDGLTVTREMYGSKVETTLDVDAPQAAVTVRPAEWPKAEGSGDASVEAFDAAIDESTVRSNVTGYQEVGGGDIDITDADVLVSVGRGIEEEDNLEIIHELAEALDAPVLAGTATYGADQSSPGTVTCTGIGQVAIGPRPGSETPEADLALAEELAAALSKGDADTAGGADGVPGGDADAADGGEGDAKDDDPPGLDVVAEPAMPERLWRKLAVNVGINPTTALARTENGALAANEIAETARTAARETARVAQATGVDLEERDAVAELDDVVDGTAENRSSMLQDVETGRHTEIDQLAGAVVDRADEHGVAVPVTRTLTGLVREWERANYLR